MEALVELVWNDPIARIWLSITSVIQWVFSLFLYFICR